MTVCKAFLHFKFSKWEAGIMDKDTKTLVLLDLYGKVLSKIQFENMDLHYNKDLSLSEISSHTGVSRQGVYDSIKKSEAILKKMESSLGFYEKLEKINENLEKIALLASKIESEISSGNLSSLKEKAKCIGQIAKNLNYKI